MFSLGVSGVSHMDSRLGQRKKIRSYRTAIYIGFLDMVRELLLRTCNQIYIICELQRVRI